MMRVRVGENSRCCEVDGVAGRRVDGGTVAAVAAVAGRWVDGGVG